ncbi:MAG TPA: HD domain-containing protein [Terriglobales bacterium]|jgi:[protein-PII] uridylyltransferase|nr:HD domain-containing protein [Terriglobales bacterium]
MTTGATVHSELRDLYARESAAIEQEFAVNGNGRTALARRTALVDAIVLRLWDEIVVGTTVGSGSEAHDTPKNFALVATGGFGRGWLFPYSDVDLLFLCTTSDDETVFKDHLRRFSQELWDLRLKVSPATRTLAECDRLDPDNVEFTISLLDCRYLAGDRELFSRLREKVIPRLVGRESHTLIQDLAEITRTRHHKFANTVFHLEPNVKDGPGGLRDYNVANWLALLSAMEKLKVWPDTQTLLPVSSRRAFDDALDFQMAVRCFLHYRHGRHDNTLTWEAQDEAAARKIGANDFEIANAADWMRVYFGHVRSVHRVCTQLLEEIPAAWSSLHRQFQGWRTKIASDDFSVVDGLIFLKQQPQQSAGLRDPEILLRLFHFMAEHGVKLSTTTEYKVEQALPALASTPPRGAELWLYLQETLLQPHAADALRAMNSLRLLALLLPELKGIEALVVRDFYHRYTVDEHSFLAIENLHRLRESQSEWDRRFALLLGEIEQPELLYLALLLHDSGKAAQGEGESHIDVSVRLTDSCADRLDLDSADRETLRFLVANHLEMSAAMRRDVFDPANVKSFADRVGAPERLKMLCLMTYADVKAVNPEAMTPWKADNLWQLYIACANYLNRSADQRVHTDANDSSNMAPSNLAHLRSLAAVAGKKLNIFLEGLPQRYLRIHGATDVIAHAEMAARLGPDGVQLSLKQIRHWYELTLVTTDRPFLFASVSGALAAWGMNIVKANAFSNAAGIVVDTFYFTDRFRTLEMNLQEWDRLKKSIADVIKGQADVTRMLSDRLKSETADSTKVKVKVATQIEFDDSCSANSTLVQILTQDRPGLLYRMCSLLSKHDCNIEIALIETEGQMAIDVLYLSSRGTKLTPQQQAALGKAVREELAPK